VRSAADKVIEQTFRSAAIYGGKTPLRVKSGQFEVPARCPLYPRKRTRERNRVISALG
jgi:hypothetical protein